jgi:hypothetical protein
MRRNPINPDSLELEDLGAPTGWAEWKPCRQMQPMGFPISDFCGERSKVQFVRTVISNIHSGGALRDSESVRYLIGSVSQPKAIVPSLEDLLLISVTIHDVAQLAAEVAELRAQFSQQMSKVMRKLSGLKERALRPRGRGRVCGGANQGTLPLLPPELSSLSDAIERSKAVVDRLQDPSDELGLTGSQEAWQRAIVILTAHALSVWQNAKVVIRPPVISAGPDGSVDLYWTAAPYGLLLNVPADPKQPATYYGDDAANPDCNRTSGRLGSGRPVDPGLLMWLAYTAGQ